MNQLRIKRKELGLTQIEAAKALGISRRTYQTYEENNIKTSVYDQLLEKLNEIGVLENSNVVLGVRFIKQKIIEVLKKYPQVHSAYLFGSYTRGEATAKSDIDILVVADVMGMDFFGIPVDLEETLHKEIDIKTHRQLLNNKVLLEEILNEGIKIYRQKSTNQN